MKSTMDRHDIRSTGETGFAIFRPYLTGVFLFLATAFVCSIACPVLAGQGDGAKALAAKHVDALSVEPGTVVRWSAPGTTRCGMGEQTWPALEETCYYPIDLLHKPGRVKIMRKGHDKRTESSYISVQPFSYPIQEIELGDIPQANPSAADFKRNSREGKMLAKIWKSSKEPAQFTLPLGAPANPLPEGRDFGAKRIFNGKPAGQPHMGADYATPPGSHIFAAADGKVVVAQDLFFPGNAVFINHGNNLITMYFHFSEIKVTAGQEVKKGDIIGLVGTTGRSTGPHLFFGIRWHNARINPQFLLDDPAKIPAVVP
jgi:hypothetical protein